jgi:3-methyladenine DNA glycosylase AlkC
MADALKEIYTRDVVASLGAAVARVDAAFDPRVFLSSVFDRTWPQRELKDRMHRIARLLYEGMSGSYDKRISRLISICPPFRGLPYLLFPDIVEQYGLDHWEPSMRALEVFTPLSSSEFAVRPFILRDASRMMKQMGVWSKSRDEHVRRLASEGCRPRLPWAMALPPFQRDPSPVLPILERLRTDSSEYVRRSVANNLNDISKDHPALVLDIARRWIKEKPETERLVKHACRTMLKRGDAGAMALFGFSDDANFAVHDLRMTARRLPIGGMLEFRFDLVADAADIRIEYAIDYLKARGHHNRKVFKISERAATGRETITRRHRMQDLTTRKHHPGEHLLHIVINGVVKASTGFELTR